MIRRFARRAFAACLLISGAALLQGCVYEPYPGPYAGYPAYGYPAYGPAYGPTVVVGGGGGWHGGDGWHGGGGDHWGGRGGNH